jgi:hypothetical protein
MDYKPPNTNFFTREIVALLLIKVLFLYILWYFFFSQPLDKDLSANQVATELLNS